MTARTTISLLSIISILALAPATGWAEDEAAEAQPRAEAEAGCECGEGEAIERLQGKTTEISDVIPVYIPPGSDAPKFRIGGGSRGKETYAARVSR